MYADVHELITQSLNNINTVPVGSKQWMTNHRDRSWTHELNYHAWKPPDTASNFDPLSNNPCVVWHSEQHDLLTNASSWVWSEDQSLPRTGPASWHCTGWETEEHPNSRKLQILNLAPSVTETNIDIGRVALFSCQAAKISYFTQEACQQNKQMKSHLSELQSNYLIRLNIPMSDNCMHCNSLC